MRQAASIDTAHFFHRFRIDNLHSPKVQTGMNIKRVNRKYNQYSSGRPGKSGNRPPLNFASFHLQP
jgi:hypothetical protein